MNHRDVEYRLEQLADDSWRWIIFPPNKRGPRSSASSATPRGTTPIRPASTRPTAGWRKRRRDHSAGLAARLDLHAQQHVATARCSCVADEEALLARQLRANRVNGAAQVIDQ